MNKQFLFLLLLLTQSLPWQVWGEVSPDSTAKNQPNQLLVAQKSLTGITLNFSLGKYFISEMSEGTDKPERSNWKQIDLPGEYPLGMEGLPHLPYVSHQIAIPNGSSPILDYSIHGTTLQSDIIVGPVAEPRSTAAEDTSGIVYRPNAAVFSKNAFYPAEPVSISEVTVIRGVQVVTLTVFPFQYNPVTHELKTNAGFDIDLNFEGGNGKYGDDRLRSRWLDPMLQSGLLNASMLAEIDYDQRFHEQLNTRATGAEYLIIRPNGAAFQQWADTIKKFRQEMGIPTKVVSLAEIGGNSQSLIKNYITNAYNTWDIPPVAVLLLGDHGTDANSRITTYWLPDHPYDRKSYGADNQYVFINGSTNIVIARITARNASELEAIIRKFMDHEYNPPMNASFYNPTSCMGWQDGSCFQVAGESLSGYFQYNRNRTPNRIYTVYNGNPSGGSWQTSSSEVDYWGPDGLGYLTAVPNPAYDWYGGNSTKINQAINNGTFLIQHHDHGYSNGTGWYRPYYTTGQTGGLNNTTYPFVMSFNCSSGKYTSEDCFSDNILRHRTGVQGHGALGIIASSYVSYFYSNEQMCWGVYDYLWPDFMPDKEQMSGHLLLPAFGLLSSKWHSGAGTLTNDLYHHFGDAFLTLYDTIPRNAVISHQSVVHPDNLNFVFLAEEGLKATLSINGSIVASQTTDEQISIISLPDTLEDGDKLVFTLSFGRNILPYRAEISVNTLAPYPKIEAQSWTDTGINANRQFDYNENPYLNLQFMNHGSNQASGFTIQVVQCDSMLIVQDSLASLPVIQSQQELWIDSLFRLAVKPQVEDNHAAWMLLKIEKADTLFFQEISFPVFSALAKSTKYGNEIGIGADWDYYWESGEEAIFPIRVQNAATSAIARLNITITGGDEMILPKGSVLHFDNLRNDADQFANINVFAQPDCPVGHKTNLYLAVTDEATQMSWYDTLTVRLKSEALVIDLDDVNSSAIALQQALEANGINVTVSSQLGENIHHYKMAFVCLGTYPNAHELTQEEGLLLEDFLLQSNGKLYLEGAETWCYDPQTAIYPLFGIQCIDDGTHNSLGTISAENPVFTMPLSFNYTGDNQYVDRIDNLPASSSEVLLKNTNGSLTFNTAVYRNAGSYQTIGASHEFGGLAEGTFTRTQLMAFYLQLFGIESKIQWTGQTEEWFDPANWSNGMVPGTNAIITIPTVPLYDHFPNLFQQDAIRVRSLILEPGVNLQIPEGKVLILE